MFPRAPGANGHPPSPPMAPSKIRIPLSNAAKAFAGPKPRVLCRWIEKGTSGSPVTGMDKSVLRITPASPARRAPYPIRTWKRGAAGNGELQEPPAGRFGKVPPLVLACATLSNGSPFDRMNMPCGTWVQGQNLAATEMSCRTHLPLFHFRLQPSTH